LKPPFLPLVRLGLFGSFGSFVSFVLSGCFGLYVDKLKSLNSSIVSAGKRPYTLVL
jgi:hypothetical protein